MPALIDNGCSPKISAHDPSAITFAGASVDAMGGDGNSLFNFDGLFISLYSLQLLNE